MTRGPVHHDGAAPAGAASMPYSIGDLVNRNVKYIIGLAGVFFVALGFNFKTPAQHFDAIARDAALMYETDSIMSRRIGAIEDEQRETRTYLRALAVAQCLDRPRRETRIMGLPCDELLAGKPLRLTP